MEVEEARFYLKLWGRHHRNDDPGLGYSPINAIHRLMTQGAVGAAISGYSDTTIAPEEVTAIDDILTHLTAEARRTLDLYYVKRQPMVRSCAIMKTSRSKFSRILMCAEERVAGLLTVKEIS